MRTVHDWPWTWTEIINYIEVVKAAAQRAAILDAPMPPKEVLFDADELDNYFAQFQDHDKGEV